MPQPTDRIPHALLCAEFKAVCGLVCACEVGIIYFKTQFYQIHCRYTHTQIHISNNHFSLNKF